LIIVDAFAFYRTMKRNEDIASLFQKAAATTATTTKKSVANASPSQASDTTVVKEEA
jgi:hypothetical protein